MKRKIPAFIITAVLLLTSSAPLATAATNAVNPNVAQEIALDICKSATQLDCIESLGILSNIGNYYPGRYKRYELQRDKKDKFGNRVRFGTAIFDIKTGSKQQTVGIQAFLSTPSFKRDIGGPSIVRLGALGSFIQNPLNDFSTKFKFVVRTSWLNPQNIHMHAKEADFSVEPISGGQRWTFIGVRTQNAIWNEKHSAMAVPPAKADEDYTDLSFVVNHYEGEKADSWFDPKCAHAGFTVEASNSSFAGQPQWNYQTHSLDFNIGAPHLTTKGKLNYGYFKTWMSDAYIHCMWPSSDLDRATQYLVTVIDSDGSTQTASVSSGNTKGVLRLSVSNFHYSTPTIKLKSLDAVAEPTPTPSPSKTP